MASFSQAVIRKLENGYVVSVTKLELSERGYQPVETHFIATTDEEVLEKLEIGSKTASVVKLETANKK